ncbi:hypothetical protein GJ496_002327 [Pomphorhynchus laevis]|nr:hypothetical protein GJ496_002327 [Pomphorhynchus laevis]
MNECKETSLESIQIVGYLHFECSANEKVGDGTIDTGRDWINLVRFNANEASNEISQEENDDLCDHEQHSLIYQMRQHYRSWIRCQCTITLIWLTLIFIGMIILFIILLIIFFKIK